MADVGLIDLFEQQLDRQRSHFFQVHVQCSQGRRTFPRAKSVITSHHFHILRHLQAFFSQRLHRANREGIDWHTQTVQVWMLVQQLQTRCSTGHFATRFVGANHRRG
ncbi:hypothetical protein D3C76_1269440 [compost metagenome]